MFSSHQALQFELREVRERIDNVTEVALELAQHCESTAAQRIQSNATCVGERYDQMMSRLTNQLKQLTDTLEIWQKFKGACADMLSWIETQEIVLCEQVTVDAPLSQQLQQLESCKVRETFALTGSTSSLSLVPFYHYLPAFREI